MHSIRIMSCGPLLEAQPDIVINQLTSLPKDPCKPIGWCRRLFAAWCRNYILRSSPTQSFLTIGKRAHLNNPAITNGIDVCKIDVVPLAAALGPNVRMDKHHNAIAG